MAEAASETAGAAQAQAAAGCDLVAAAAALGAQAEERTRVLDFAGAAAALGEAAVLYAQAGRFAEQGKHLYGQGILLMRLDGQAEAAQQALKQSAALAHIFGDTEAEVRAIQRIADLRAAGGDLQAGLAQLDLAAVRLRGKARPDLAVQVHRGQAAMLLSLGRLEPALAALKDATGAAEELGDARLVLELKLTRRGLLGLRARGTEKGPLADLLREADELGDPGLRADVGLQQAAALLRGGDVQAALTAAEQVRRQALELPDPLRYMLACLLLAEGREQLGDYVGVLKILLTCKVSLERFVGPEAGAAVVQVLDSLAGRWGQDALDEARRRYREQAQARREREQQAGQSES
jgi:hypothetical protein